MLTQAESNNLLQTALQHHLAGRLSEAEPLYQRLLNAFPLLGDANHLYGVLLAQRGQYDAALPLLRRAIYIAPSSAEFHRHLADTLGLMNKLSDALDSYRTAVLIDPRDVNAHYGMARTLAGLNRNSEAAAALQQVLALAPQHANALADLGIVLTRTGQLEDSVSVLRRALQMKPDLGEAWTALSDALRRLGRVEEALEPAQRGAALQPRDPWALTAVGNVLQVLARFPEACAQYEASLAVEQNNFDAVNNLGLTLLKMGEGERSMALFDQAMARWPESNDLRANRSLALLTLGRWKEGFAEYEVRFQLPVFAAHQLPLNLRWSGGEIAGKTILLNSEQGLGDTVQFIRYIPLLAERGARVLLFCPAPLRPLASTVDGVSQIFSEGESAPTFDLWAPMASLPYLCATDVDSVPNRVPYLKPDPQRAQAWKQRFAADPGLKVGIVWAGTPAHMNDRARSARLDDFAPLAHIPSVRLYSLQKGPAAAALATSPLAPFITPLGDSLNDFADTAALLEAVDLLISVDTSVVHVAGALARPCWTLLARGPDWRWLLGRDDTPWYPTMRLFRQQQLGDWKTVLDRVARQLQELVQQTPKP